MQVTVEEAKSILAELCQLAQAGQEIVITKDGQPYMKLLACEGSTADPKPDRKPGALKGKIWVSPDFDEPLDQSSDLTGPEERT